MPIVTLTTDWNNNDYYTAMVKGRILSECPDTTIIDVSHQIRQFDVAQAAFIIKSAFTCFPIGTIHIISVNSTETPENQHVIIKKDEHYFIATDTGLFNLIFEEPVGIEIYKIENINNQAQSCLSFPELHVFAPVACHILKGKPISDLGVQLTELFRQVPLYPTIDESIIIGRVVYIDTYQNVITNISNELFTKISRNRRFTIYIKSHHYKVTKISTKYTDVAQGEIVALFNSQKLLELAINSGNLVELLNIDSDALIRVNFINE